MAGKGDKRRPMKVSAETYSSNWDAIFGGGIDMTKLEADKRFWTLLLEQVMAHKPVKTRHHVLERSYKR